MKTSRIVSKISTIFWIIFSVINFVKGTIVIDTLFICMTVIVVSNLLLDNFNDCIEEIINKKENTNGEH